MLDENNQLLNTNDPILKLSITSDVMLCDIASIQKKQFKRSTAKIKKRQLDYILNCTAQIFDVKQFQELTDENKVVAQT